MIPAPHSSMRIIHLRQRLRNLGAKPCHEECLLRGGNYIHARVNSSSIALVMRSPSCASDATFSPS